MNKYQKSLEQIKNIVLDEQADGYYQPKTVAHYYNQDVNTLQKLVDKFTPKLVKYEDIGYDYYGGGDNVYACICPSCGLGIIEFDDSMIPNCRSDDPKEMFHSCMIHHGNMGLNSFCNRCGQALDWSNENER